ncbi:MAG TPA: nuclear transport factor 2 family protein [Pusillimonas sp.]|uniref:nuclear transport factor 2 family protein n=1 Tax=Pusillimonas sp. TaxID=3040095 RepID=UPI002BDC0020|nr:nuclear transport factor 2 family protein [Pusillimonas sp.]HUH87483.1 nuclear transport factor 2 family protein [Pusillimonas sp.]
MNTEADAERQLMDADDERCRAMLAHDLDALRMLLADDVVYTHSSAVVDTKESYLNTLSQGNIRYLASQRKSAHVRLYGQVAIMHGHVTMQIEHQGHKKDLNNLYQAVWVQRAGRWQLVSWASTVIPPQAKTM